MAKAKETANVTDGYDYGVTKIRNADGKVRSSRGNGDAVANAMLLFTAKGGDVREIITRNKLDDKMKPHLKKQPGLLRMTLGVVLRALVKNGTPVRIGKITVENLSQKIDMPKVETAPRAAKAAKPAKKAARKSSPRRRKASAEAGAEEASA